MLINSGTNDRAALGLKEAKAVPTFVPISKNLAGNFRKKLAIVFDTLSPFTPKFLKKSLRSSSCNVSAETVLDFFLLHIEE